LFAKQTFACVLFYGQKASNLPGVENITTCDLYDTVKSAYLAARCRPSEATIRTTTSARSAPSTFSSSMT
jgi:hypothetical protein